MFLTPVFYYVIERLVGEHPTTAAEGSIPPAPKEGVPPGQPHPDGHGDGTNGTPDGAGKPERQPAAHH